MKYIRIIYALLFIVFCPKVFSKMMDLNIINNSHISGSVTVGRVNGPYVEQGNKVSWNYDAPLNGPHDGVLVVGLSTLYCKSSIGRYLYVNPALGNDATITISRYWDDFGMPSGIECTCSGSACIVI